MADAEGGYRDVSFGRPTPPATRLGWLVCTTTACDGCLLLAGFRLLLRRGRATVHTHCAHPQPAQFVTCPWLGRRDWAGLALPAPLDGRTHSARLFVACPFLVGLPPSFGGEGPAQACAAAQIFGQGSGREKKLAAPSSPATPTTTPTAATTTTATISDTAATTTTTAATITTTTTTTRQ